MSLKIDRFHDRDYGTEPGGYRAKEENMKVKFYNGRKLVLTVLTNTPARVINYHLTHDDIEWTRYKII